MVRFQDTEVLKKRRVKPVQFSAVARSEQESEAMLGERLLPFPIRKY
jgi:hypothetical protein